MGIIVHQCALNYDCSKCITKQTDCVAYAQKKWQDVSVLNQKHLSELEAYKSTGLTLSEIAVLAQAKADGRLEIILCGDNDFCSYGERRQNETHR